MLESSMSARSSLAFSKFFLERTRAFFKEDDISPIETSLPDLPDVGLRGFKFKLKIKLVLASSPIASDIARPALAISLPASTRFLADFNFSDPPAVSLSNPGKSESKELIPA